MEERKEGLDKSKTCCLHGPWPSKPIDQTRNCLYLFVFVFVSVSSCCSLLFCDDCLYTVLSASRSSLLSFYPLNVDIDCFIILDKVFRHNLLLYDRSRHFYKLESHVIVREIVT